MGTGTRGFLVVMSAALASSILFVGSLRAQRRLDDREAGRAERACRRGRGDAAACREAGGHRITFLGAEAGQAGLQLLEWGCAGGDGQACRMMSGAYGNGRPDQRIAVQLGLARAAAERGCALYDMSSCQMVERYGGTVEPITADALVALVETFDQTTTVRGLAAACTAQHGEANSGRRPDGSQWSGCNISRYAGNQAAGVVRVMVFTRGSRVVEVYVSLTVQPAGITMTPEGTAFGEQLVARRLDELTRRWGLVPDPQSPSWVNGLIPTTARGLSVRAGRDNISVTYTPADFVSPLPVQP